jgi:hypothetical protein
MNIAAAGAALQRVYEEENSRCWCSLLRQALRGFGGEEV